MIYNIYKITNTINDKVYIGQTSYPIAKRFREHINRAKYESNIVRPLYSAMRKHGVENFKIELIERVKTKKLTNAREKYWINYYNSFLGRGYNATEGGEGGSSRKKEVLQINRNTFEIINKFCSTHEAGKYLGKKNGKISNACLCKCIAYGYLWIYQSDYEKLDIPLNEYFVNIANRTKPILQIDKESNRVINEFNSISEAANKTGFVKRRIHRVCNGERKTYKGFIWKYKNECA